MKRHIYEKHFRLGISVSLLLFAITTFCCVPRAFSQSSNVSISNFVLVNKQRVGLTTYDYTFRASLTNIGTIDLINVTASASSIVGTTLVVDGLLTFGSIPIGTTVSSTDTFVVRIDRRYVFHDYDISWAFNYTQVAGSQGGTFQGTGNTVVIVPPGATSESIPITVQPLQQSEIGKDVPPGFTFVGAAALDIGDVVLNDNADIGIPAPNGLPVGAQLYVAQVVEYAGGAMFMMVDTASVQGNMVISQDPGTPGITQSGTYVFLWGNNIGWVSGQVTHKSGGAAVPEAVVTMSGGYWLCIADSTGHYKLPAWAGNFVVVAFDDQTAEHGEKQGFVPSNGASVVANIQIGETSGQVQSDLTNGGFEQGLTGWQSTGAVSAASSLGPIKPYAGSYMGKISSGSGAIGGASSALEQTFKVPSGAKKLTVRYNFVSEEYPEFVGSEFNDVFNATLFTPEGSRQIAFEEVNSAPFKPVSGIPCGSGDCTWGETGWLVATIDVSQWAGTNDTITLTVHDVGDTVYDSIVLLDNITIQEDEQIQLQNVPVLNQNDEEYKVVVDWGIDGPGGCVATSFAMMFISYFNSVNPFGVEVDTSPHSFNTINIINSINDHLKAWVGVDDFVATTWIKNQAILDGMKQYTIQFQTLSNPPEVFVQWDIEYFYGQSKTCDGLINFIKSKLYNGESIYFSGYYESSAVSGGHASLITGYKRENGIESLRINDTFNNQSNWWEVTREELVNIDDGSVTSTVKLIRGSSKFSMTGLVANPTTMIVYAY